MERPASCCRCCALVSARFFRPKWGSALPFLCRDTRQSALLAHEHGRHFAIPAPASKFPMCRRGILFMSPRERTHWRLRPFPVTFTDSLDCSCLLLPPAAAMLMASSAARAMAAGGGAAAILAGAGAEGACMLATAGVPSNAAGVGGGAAPAAAWGALAASAAAAAAPEALPAAAAVALAGTLEEGSGAFGLRGLAFLSAFAFPFVKNKQVNVATSCGPQNFPRCTVATRGAPKVPFRAPLIATICYTMRLKCDASSLI
eukprot:1156785-Pelagomonas_calceolata.AAC.11